MTSCAVKPYDLPLAIPYRWSHGVQHRRLGAIVRIDLAGHLGWGECAPPPDQPMQGTAFADEIARAMADLDPVADDFLAQVHARGVRERIRCGIATAWLSARAAGRGQSLSALLSAGRARPAARVPVNDLVTDDDPQLCVQRTRDAVARGQSTVKVKCTTDRDLDLRRVGAIRQAFEQVAIRIDPNESWPIDWALDQLRAMAGLGIEYCEEPLPVDSGLDAYAELRRHSPIPIALDNSVRSIDSVRQIIDARAADVLILKTQRIGGPDLMLEVFDLARSARLACTVTASLETAVGLMMAVHVSALQPDPIAPGGLGTARYFAEDVCPPPPIVDGHMSVPTTAGLGCDPQPWWDAH